MPHELYWLIFLLPVISFVISVLLKPFISNDSKVPGYITILAIAGSLFFSISALVDVMGAHHHVIEVPEISWVVIGNFHISVGMIMDSLTAVMADGTVSVAGVSEIHTASRRRSGRRSAS